ncbi:leukocyte immunoglobulin-like receptor subfamily B member 3 isoform X2 [Oreochromis aureus]|uniref:leukocyte immunoglobulin-like receptor subfamily B member 3 isoform X1 n=1 Tax=Oreochromis aureus TaxID=47969 RepID=UPI001954093B|nr:leukocyte immunoglobulin-like receptor subfamily B member 3 isoform X1 [Oreochromis aureus]XP_039466300.1 leukocyte immunoglobulin-like receptor subfamily B member 3 isoform X2 [Oreochromis aureus]XP_039466301.1 leukocyte immunoglobulin-like receptor subfamily B member 3 isoform X2 [Oreochromis aureus]
MGPTFLCELGLFFLCTLLCSGHAQDAVLTVEPSSTIFIGETVSFKCDMKEGKHTDWEYKIIMDGRELFNSNTNKDLRLKVASTAQSGKYSCSAHRKSSQNTKNSNTVSVTVKAGKPRATLTPGSTIISVGGSVTLTCSVGSSADWKYEWFRRDQNTEVQIRTDDQQNRVIRVSEGGIYHCRGRRGNPDYYTDKSDDVTIEKTISNKVVVKGRPSWPQILSSETISLTCEVQEGGETTEWEYRWRGPKQTTQWTHNNYWIFNVSESSSGDYMCKSRRRDDSYSSTEWSEAFNLSVSNAVLTVEPSSTIFIGETVSFKCEVKEGKHTDWEYKIIMDGRELFNSSTNKGLRLKVASTAQSGKYSCSAHRKSSQNTKNSNTVSVTVKAGKPRATLTPGSTIIPVGGSVTLTCSVGSSAGWKYEWFRRDPNTDVKIRTDDQQNRVIRVSEGGIYRCRGRRGNPDYYTDKSDDVTIEITSVLSSESSSFLMIAGLISGTTFIFLLLLLCCCMKSKVFNKGSADDQRVSQDEDQQQVYSSLLHGDRCVYETIRGSKSTDTGQIEGDSCVIHFKVINKTQPRGDPEESSDYYNVNPNSSPGP